MRRAGIENACLHTLRHTYASHLVMAGVDIPTVQKLLGHSDISTTMRYAHLAPEHLRKAIDKMGFSFCHFFDTEMSKRGKTGKIVNITEASKFKNNSR